jgi:hypothetical protein
MGSASGNRWLLSEDGDTRATAQQLLKFIPAPALAIRADAPAMADFPPVELGTGFTVHLCHKSAPSLQELKGLPLVQLEFTASSVPWRLNEPEAD